MSVSDETLALAIPSELKTEHPDSMLVVTAILTALRACEDSDAIRAKSRMEAVRKALANIYVPLWNEHIAKEDEDWSALKRKAEAVGKLGDILVKKIHGRGNTDSLVSDVNNAVSRVSSFRNVRETATGEIVVSVPIASLWQTFEAINNLNPVGKWPRFSVVVETPMCTHDGCTSEATDVDSLTCPLHTGGDILKASDRKPVMTREVVDSTGDAPNSMEWGK